MKPVVDEVTRKQVLEQVKQQFRILCDVYDRGKRDPRMWCRALIYLVYRIMRIGAVGDALDMLALFPENWFRDELPGEMANDKNFESTVLDLCKLLVEYEVVSVDAKPLTGSITQFTIGQA